MSFRFFAKASPSAESFTAVAVNIDSVVSFAALVIVVNSLLVSITPLEDILEEQVGVANTKFDVKEGEGKLSFDFIVVV